MVRSANTARVVRCRCDAEERAIDLRCSVPAGRESQSRSSADNVQRRNHAAQSGIDRGGAVGCR
jgi:hypothetical protein